LKFRKKARIVNQDVNPSELLHSIAGHSSHAFFIGYISMQCDCLTASLYYFLLHPRSIKNICNNNTSTLFGELQGISLSNPSGPAGNDSYSPLKLYDYFPPYKMFIFAIKPSPFE
jgi:hypothetical protein